MDWSSVYALTLVILFTLSELWINERRKHQNGQVRTETIHYYNSAYIILIYCVTNLCKHFFMEWFIARVKYKPMSLYLRHNGARRAINKTILYHNDISHSLYFCKWRHNRSGNELWGKAIITQVFKQYISLYTWISSTVRMRKLRRLFYSIACEINIPAWTISYIDQFTLLYP